MSFRHVCANSYSEAAYSDKVRCFEFSDTEIVPYFTYNRDRKVTIKSPCLNTLTPELRAELGALPEVVFVKTHELPPAEPVAGECAIQLVRHPAAALLSEMKLANAMKPDRQRELNYFVDGLSNFGSWSDYHNAWGATSMPLLREHFERAVDDPQAFILKLAEFTKLQPVALTSVSAQDANARNPVRNPTKGKSGWQADISCADLAHIWERHGETAKAFNYCPFGLSI